MAVAYKQEAATTPLLGPTVAPTLADQLGTLTKLVPVTVTVLPTYASAGAMEVEVGLGLTERGVPETETETPPNVSNTVDEAAGVPAAITTLTVAALTYKHDAADVPLPALGPTVAPTLAVHAELGKLVPVTVMVLRAYAAVGEMDVAD